METVACVTCSGRPTPICNECWFCENCFEKEWSVYLDWERCIDDCDECFNNCLWIAAVELKFYNHIKKWTEIGNEIRVRYDTKKWTEIRNEIRVRYESKESYLAILKEHIRRFEHLIVQLEFAADSKDRATCHSIMDTLVWIADAVARDFPVSGKRAGNV